jgi:sterol desaturase/sphingolipid hydroxylase (fatty acid hydroxylase superfamily)
MTTFVRLTKAGYYADFVFYPILLLLLAGIAVDRDTLTRLFVWAAFFGIGLAAWTLLEYWLHRILFHWVFPFRVLHDMHHAAPTAKIGTPTWVTGSVICGCLLLGWEAGFNLASGLTAGLAAGYLWYVSMHHAAHHWRSRPGTYLHTAKLRHASHHHARYPCCFGVTTAFWDRVFRTARWNPLLSYR